MVRNSCNTHHKYLILEMKRTIIIIHLVENLIQIYFINNIHQNNLTNFCFEFAFILFHFLKLFFATLHIINNYYNYR